MKIAYDGSASFGEGTTTIDLNGKLTTSSIEINGGEINIESTDIALANIKTHKTVTAGSTTFEYEAGIAPNYHYSKQ